MSAASITTKHLKLTLESPEDVRAFIDQLSPEEKVELSPHWLTMVETTTVADPWVHGFTMTLWSEDVEMGRCGFKGPPDADGVVEIAYGIEPDYQGKGYATEAAQALTNFAFSSDRVRIVRAHTLPEQNASTRVLTKCGFQCLGEVTDPEDGLVWRWEKRKED